MWVWLANPAYSNKLFKTGLAVNTVSLIFWKPGKVTRKRLAIPVSPIRPICFRNLSRFLFKTRGGPKSQQVCWFWGQALSRTQTHKSQRRMKWWLEVLVEFSHASERNVFFACPVIGEEHVTGTEASSYVRLKSAIFQGIIWPQQKNSLHLHFHREIRTASNRNLLNIFELGLQRTCQSLLFASGLFLRAASWASWASAEAMTIGQPS